MNRYIQTFAIMLAAWLTASNGMAQEQDEGKQQNSGSESSSTGVRIHGNVYGGGNLADVQTNTEVNICVSYNETTTQYEPVSAEGVTIHGNVYGGGRGKADNFTCDKAMVGIVDQGVTGTGEEGNPYVLQEGGTTVRIGNGTVKGDVFGGGEVGRVERNTMVTIGTETGASAPVIEGHVFGAGKGLETHGYSALVRGNCEVIIQGDAEVWQNVHGGGEKASVGRYLVATTQALADEYHVAMGMPCLLKAGGKCTVTIQGTATIGKDAGTGDVFGAGQGIMPVYNNTPESNSRSKRMVYYDSDTHTEDTEGSDWEYYESGSPYVWEYFSDEASYLLYVETLARASETDVNIGGDATIKGTVYGGSESGFVYYGTDVDITGGTINGDAFGGGKGLSTFAEAGRVRRNTNLTISGGAVNGNVYGGGSLGDVGTITKPADYNYTWKKNDGSTANAFHNNTITGTNDNTGICTVSITDGTIGISGTVSPDHGNVFGAGKGTGITWWCEKAIAYATSVSVSGGTVNGNVYGGGQVGRVEDDAKVVIGVANATGDAAPAITGSVFGAGAGLKTHGYSALVRGNAAVTVQGTAQVGGSVYGGGETASVGRFTVVGGLPKHPDSGGYCTVTIKDNAKIGTSGTGHNVYGACKGVTPAYDENNYKSVYSMQIYENRPSDTPGDTWEYYTTYEEGYTGQKFIKRYYASEDDYKDFLQTLALTSHPTVTIDESATVYGSVYGGGERGLTLGNVAVNINGGIVEQDVYGGGALANSNAGNWDADGYTEVTGLTANESSVTGLYTLSGTTYTKITDEAATADGVTTYYSKGKWKDDDLYTTTVNLLGGLVKGDAYGGGLGQKTGFNGATSDIAATVYGDINVTLNGTAFYITNYEDEGYTHVVKSGRVFGCNNLLGSPQGDVTVTVYKTVSLDEGGEVKEKPTKETHTYEVAAVYGGGNLASYTAAGKKAHVIIHGCDDTSIETVYGGGNAAAVPETRVDVYSSYEIESLFGGGNGSDMYKNDAGWKTNPGANVDGNANSMIYGGTVHEAYGGSNDKGTITGDVTIDLGANVGDKTCTLDVAKLVGAGKNADVNGDLKIIMGCKPDVKVPLVFGGADNANVNGDVELTITSGNWGTVVGGNNNGGVIRGHIILNIEETSCIPINIDELYGCGYNALYSEYGYYIETEETDGVGAPTETAILTAGKLHFLPRQSADDPHLPVKSYSLNGDNWTWTVFTGEEGDVFTPYASPEVNIVSCTHIGQVFGGGYGATATVYGNPTVNINMIPGEHASEISRNGVTSNANALGEIGDVFGGGNQAAVWGNTTVNVATETAVQLHESISREGVYTMSEDKTVTGAYISGNVYGGGKLADIGKTHLGKDNDNKDIDVIDIKGSTFVNIGAVKGAEILDDLNNPTGRYNYTSVSFTPTDAPGIFIGGNVYGGGMGEAAEPEGTNALPGAFRCGKAMVTKNTNVAIGNGTIGDGDADHGHVYGGGEKGRVEENTSVTIGCENDENSKPVITGNVFGAGKGVNTHGYSALARGNSYVTVQGEAKVKKSVYGGGEIASVGKYNIVSEADLDNPSFVQNHPGLGLGMPWSLANQGSGYCYVTVRDNAVIGPDAAMVMTANGYPDDMGHVFGAGKGVLPYEGYADNEKAWRVTPDNTKQEYLSKTEAIEGTNESTYLPYVETLGLATQTYVIIDENAFVKGSVYGGSENGYVQHHTQVNIQGNCQIGNGYVQMEDNGTYLAQASMRGVNRRYTAAEWAAGRLFPASDPDYTLGTDTELENLVSTNNYYTTSLPECASWPYGQATGDDKYAPWDKYYGTANYDSKGGRTTADDGHTFYGNVFGGGSGVIPYRPGKWHPEAGSVGGNTEVNITGGHILTNIYGGNELTDVYGKCTVNFSGGTLGVPRTLKQIAAHPLTCYLFGAGKGDQRVLFNKSTNVKDVEVNIKGGTIYGSVFGGGEDGHVHRDVKMTIGNNDHTGPTIGQWGTSYVDGNIFGGGRGFGADAYTAGNVAGSVKMEIKGGSILGSIYGGGRLGSVGYGLFDATNTDNYGVLQDDDKDDEGNTTNFFKEGSVGLGRGHIDITISGGTIGNEREYIIPNSDNIPTGLPATISTWTAENWKTWKAHNNIPKTEFDTSTGRLTHTKGGNVFAGGMGNFYKQDGSTPISVIDWWKLGNVKSTKLTITGGNIKSNVYGGGELGWTSVTHTATIDGAEKAVSTEVSVTGGTIGTEVAEAVTTGTGSEATTSNIVRYTYGSVFGGGYGSSIEKLMAGSKETNPKFQAGRVKYSTKVDISGNAMVKASVYGGGEVASVGYGFYSYDNDNVIDESAISDASEAANTWVSIGGDAVIGKDKDETNNIYYGGATMGNVYGGGSGNRTIVRCGLILGNTNVNISGGTIHHNIYGGGAYGSVGDFEYETQKDPVQNTMKVYGVKKLHTTGTGTANVTITGGIIGVDGRENGMVFGSSRGDVQGEGTRDDYMAFVNNAIVTIGTSNDNNGPHIRGTVYGSGENGHTLNDTSIDIHSGTIGIIEGSPLTTGSVSYEGAAYPYRGNVYGGGCGTDTYLKNGVETFNPLAGVVYGTTTINMDGGQVARNIYGAGAMGSVGKATTANDGTTVSGGTTTINVSGGTVGVDGTNGDGNVFGAARGDASATINQFALVRKSTNVSVTGGTIKGNVYGGGELGSVGTFTVSNDMRTFTWTDTNGTVNAANNEKNTGVCHVTVNGSSAAINGKVFGGGKGLDDTFWCEKGIAYSTKVNIVEGTVTGNVYGGGEVGRVETDSYVKIGDGDGTAEGTSTPSIMGSVFGGGAGVETHGYSALVRGDTKVTVEGNASVAHSVYGGGEIASVGKYGLDAQKMPSILQGGGYCYVTVRGHANIAEDVFGAGQGVTPHFDNDDKDHSKRSRRMTVYTNSTDFPDSSGPNGSGTWEYYENYPDDYSGTKFVWDYYQTSESYSTYLETLALATHPEVTIDGDATVNGSVFGGGELGLTKGSVIVTIKGGTIAEDVYGGGSLANTNTTSTVDLDGDGETETVDPTTTVRLTGGTINRNVYGGGLGRLAKDAVAAVLYTAEDAEVTEGTKKVGDVKTPAQPAVEAIAAKVYGDVQVDLNKPTTTTTGEGEGATTTTTYGDCEVKGNIFGCNNLNGSPQGGVTVHVYKTVTKNESGTEKAKPEKDTNKYELAAVYGGGNLAAFYPDDATTRATAKANVIIDGCDQTSIGTVYGGGNAASVPETDVVINSAYEIGQAFGGGNGADEYVIDGKTYENPGANVGYMSYAYHTWDDIANKYIAHEYTDADDTDKDASTKDKRETNYGTGYGTGKAHVTVKGGTVHEVYAGSNTRGNIRVESRATLVDADDDDNTCEFNVTDAYGGGRNALQDGDAILDIGCISGLGKAYGGASNADVNGDVILNITNGTYGQVFGGNDMGGCIRGSITVNVEETGCRPVIIGELYGGGNKAAYSVYGYNDDGTLKISGTAVTSPTVNVRSFTSIGRIFGGGYGEEATMVGDPTVNINVVKGKYENDDRTVIGEGARVIGSSVKEPGKDGYDATKGFPIPSHTINAIGAIKDVFGGGNQAEVIGTPHVMVGTQEYVEIVTASGNVTGYYTRTGEGTSENPYVYNDATGTAVEETTYYKKVEGVDIRGNVYGGGNNAEVTGDTKVVIGKKVE